MIIYNEIEPSAAGWLRNLALNGMIPAGRVDERPIQQLTRGDLDGATQFHTFAGIGGWPLALRLAGWPDDLPVWTGSCPCQPFSVSGKRKGEEDERHLWPVFKNRIAECLPPVVFGEQVASADGRVWLAGVRADLEALGYRVGAADLCAAGVSAPHIRQRFYWVADRSNVVVGKEDFGQAQHAGRSDSDGGLGNAESERRSERQRDPRGVQGARGGHESQEPEARGPSQALGDARSSVRSRLAHPGRLDAGRDAQEGAAGGRESAANDLGERSRANGPWDGAVARRWADGTTRRIELETLALADGLPEGLVRVVSEQAEADYKERGRYLGFVSPLRVGEPNRIALLKGYGNAIVPALAAEFIMAYMDVRAEEDMLAEFE